MDLLNPVEMLLAACPFSPFKFVFGLLEIEIATRLCKYNAHLCSGDQWLGKAWQGVIVGEPGILARERQESSTTRIISQKFHPVWTTSSKNSVLQPDLAKKLLSAHPCEPRQHA